MPDTQRYDSPDGRLHFIVVTDHTGDISLGFDGFTWHTHADILAAEYQLPESEAVNHFINDLLNNRKIIALSKINGTLADVWITTNPADEQRYLQADETIE